MTTSSTLLPAASSGPAAPAPGLDETAVRALRSELQDQFSIESITFPVNAEQPIRFGGRLLNAAEQAFPIIRGRFQRLGYTPILRRAGDEDVVLAMPGVTTAQPARAWINAALFLLTLLTTLFIGASMEMADGGLPSTLAAWLAGVPFSFTLLAILGTHELGHYFVARWHKVDVTLPYFIPVPFGLGTFGAFIKMKSPEGNSLLYGLLKLLIYHQWLPGNGVDVHLSSMAFAAWFGLLVTAFNLLPVGQLDGGHILYALGVTSRWLGYGVLAVLLVLGALAWSGWYVWAALIYFVTGLEHPAPLDEITRLDPPRRWLGAIAIVIFILLFAPIPLASIP